MCAGSALTPALSRGERERKRPDGTDAPVLPRAGVHDGAARGRTLLLSPRRQRFLLARDRDPRHRLRDQVPPPVPGRPPAADRGLHPARDRLVRHPARDRADVLLLGSQALLRHAQSSQRCHRDLRRRQAVDVEDPALRRAARDQRAPRAGRTAGAPDDDLRGRDPRFLRPRVPHEAGRCARAVRERLVPGHAARPLSSLLRAVLRHEALRDDRLDRRDGAGGLPDLALGRRRRRVARRDGGEIVRSTRL